MPRTPITTTYTTRTKPTSEYTRPRFITDAALLEDVNGARIYDVNGNTIFLIGTDTFNRIHTSYT